MTPKDETTPAPTPEMDLRAIINGVRDHAISLLDAEGHILTWNATAERLKGYTLDEVRGRHFRLLFNDADQAAGLPEHELEVARREGHWRGEGWRRRKDGSQFPAAVSVSAIPDGRGGVRGFVKVTQDVTERRRMEDALRLSEERLATTLHSIGDAVIATDAAGRVTFMNPVAEALTRWPAEQARGRPLPEVFHIVNEYSRELVESPVDKVLREGVVVGLANHTALIARDGSERSIADSGAPIRDARGGIAGVVLVFRDVTSERLALDREHLLAEATAQLAASLDHEATLRQLARLAVPRLADWCVIELLDARGVLRPLEVVHADPGKVAWARALAERYPVDMAADAGSPRIVRTGRAELVAEVTEDLLATVARDEEQLRLLRAVGITSYVAAPLTARGRVLGVLTLVTAESRQRYGAEDLAFAEELARRAALALDNARLYREAQEANQLKDDFLASLSHELRTPLTAVLGWTRLLRNNALPAEKRERALEVVERNAAAQARLVEDLLDLSRVVAGTLRLNLAPVDIARVVQLAVDGVRPAAESKGVILRAELDGGAGTVTGDADRLQQVVWNLLTNAVKFTSEGGEVAVELRRDGAHVELAVTDTGEGIPASFLPYVFDRFRQADASRTRPHGGLGLGLAIVRQLVELHGGSVDAASKGEGRGSRFTVRLPIVAGVAAEAVGAAAAGSSPSAEVRASLAGLRVLLVEDDADARDYVATVLQGAGADVEAVGSARAALESLERAAPDVLVSDLGMPGEDGYSLIRKVRARPAGRGGRVPALALTAYARTEDRTRALAAGFNNHVAKPIEPEELLVVVANLAGIYPTG